MSAIDQLTTDVRRQIEDELRAELEREGRPVGDIAAGQDSWFNFRRGRGKLLLSVSVPVLLLVILVAVAIWGLGNIAEASSIEEARRIGATTHFTLLAALVVMIGLLFTGGYYLMRDVTDVAERLVRAMAAIARARTDFEIQDQHRPDEFGDMARSLEIMRRGTRRLLTLTEREKAGRAEREQLRSAQKQELLALSADFDRMVGDIVSSVAAAASQLHATASDMARAAEQSSQRSEQVGRSMEQAATGATAAAAASDEFAMSIGEISRQAADSAQMARTARATAGDADKTISALDEAATQIGQVVDLISTIASRTNLLALNASIEAARGGEAGRGFAVVASEVKELAAQTTRATEDVAAHIRAIQESTGASVKALRTVSAEIEQIETTAVAIASAVDQQSVAGQDLARSIDLAARNSEDVGRHVREVRENSLLTGSAASQVLTSAGELERQASILRAQVDAFMAKITNSAE